MYSNNSQICQDPSTLGHEATGTVEEPPYCNTGVSIDFTPPTTLPTPFFDWYSVTFSNGSIKFIQRVLNHIQASFPALDIAPQGKGLHGYSHSFTIKGPTGTLHAIGMYGNQAGTFTLQINGGEGFCNTFANWVRKHYEEHSVSRSDTAIDFDNGPGTWDYLYNLANELYEQLVPNPKNRKIRQIGDYRNPNPVEGRTIYFGSSSSATQLMLYEKGKESPDSFGPNAVRLEIMTKPAKAKQKQLASKLSPYQLASANPLARLIFEHFGEPAENPRLGTTYKEPTPMAQLAKHAYNQYGKVFDHIVEMAEAKGDPTLALQAIKRMKDGLPPFPEDEPAPPLQPVEDAPIVPIAYDWLQLSLH